MPIVRIDVTGPKPPEWKSAVLQGVRSAITDSLQVPDGRVSARLVETPDDCVDVPDCRTDRFTMIEIIMYEGRDADAKHALVETIRARLAADPGVEPSEVAVLVRDASTLDLDVLPGQAGPEQTAGVR